MLKFLIYSYTEHKDPKALVTLFTYSVINDLRNAKWAIPFNELAEESVIASIADELLKNQKVVGSIGKYLHWELVSFGEQKDSEGFTKRGGSTRTIGYQTVREYLVRRGLSTAT